MIKRSDVTTLLCVTAVLVAWLYILPAMVTYIGGVWDVAGVTTSLSTDTLARQKADPDSVQIVGFVEDRSLHILFISYLACFVLANSFQGNMSWSFFRPSLLVGVALFALWQWPHWVRNAIQMEDSRRIYSCYNADIHFPSFLLQEFRILGLMLLIAVVIRAALDSIVSTREPEVASELLAASAAASNELSKWYFRSVLLACVFSPLTYFYWRNIIVRGAGLFIPSAIMIHVIWLVTWIAISIQLVTAWREWQTSRSNMLASILSLPASEMEARLSVLDHTDPTSDLRVLGSVIFAAVAFLAPIIVPLMQ